MTDTIEVHGEVIMSHPLDAARTFWAIRLRMPAGGGLPFWTHPGLTMVYVESGMIGFTSVTGNVQLTLNNDVSGTERAVTGVEYLLRQGHVAAFGAGVQQSIRNPATEVAVFMVTMITPRASTPYDGLRTSEGYRITFAN